MGPTRAARGPGQGRLRHTPPGFPERVALYLVALHRERAATLLEGLSAAPRARAEAYMEELIRCDSAMRQARLTREFGTLPDAIEHLQQLVVDASPPLRRALARHLPPAFRARFAHLEGGEAPPPAMDAFAARLVREVLRARAG